MTALFVMGGPVQAQQADAHDHSHSHDHDHDHGGEDIRRGLFDDAQIKDRPLSDWQGDWQSVYPLLQDGTLDVVMDHKAHAGSQSAADYRAEYEAGYRTHVDRIVIEGDRVTFYQGDQSVSATYHDDGHEVLTYKAGNRGVRYVFEKVAGDDAAAGFIQFSDHGIFPQKAGHYHLYWGNDRAALLDEVTNWPTYYPTSMDRAQIVQEMLSH
ncbi:MAG: metal-binding protein ZinT [Paracoccus sp. (in: a-proteobacteria)]|nr:metal-binding protein ZinT [Paracoccus sp. (in: a-proteobacteria)]